MTLLREMLQLWHCLAVVLIAAHAGIPSRAHADAVVLPITEAEEVATSDRDNHDVGGSAVQPPHRWLDGDTRSAHDLEASEPEAKDDVRPDAHAVIGLAPERSPIPHPTDPAMRAGPVNGTVEALVCCGLPRGPPLAAG